MSQKWVNYRQVFLNVELSIAEQYAAMRKCDLKLLYTPQYGTKFL